MWKLSVIDDESNRTEVKLIRSDYTLGRAEGNTIRLTERNISRKHARISRAEGGANGWTLEDCGSFTGSFVNGTRVAGRRPLVHGDSIVVGDYRLELVDTREEANPAAEGPTEPVESLPDRLVMMYGPAAGGVFRLEGDRLLVGRGDECQLLLDDVSVSRVHVEIVRTEHGLMILDKKSSNGLRINGVELASAMLRAGDVVELGDVRLKFVPAGVADKQVPQAVPGGPRALLGRGFSARGALYWVLGALVVGLAVWAVSGGRRGSRTPSRDVVAQDPVAGPDKALQEARKLLARGAVVEAHLKLREIPKESSLRQSPVLKRIEERWADEMFRAAEHSPDPAERRLLLDAIAGSPDVDGARRSRAAEMSRELSKPPAWTIQDLPHEADSPERSATAGGAEGKRARRRRASPKSQRKASTLAPEPAGAASASGARARVQPKTVAGGSGGPRRKTPATPASEARQPQDPAPAEGAAPHTEPGIVRTAPY